MRHEVMLEEFNKLLPITIFKRVDQRTKKNDQVNESQKMILISYEVALCKLEGNTTFWKQTYWNKWIKLVNEFYGGCRIGLKTNLFFI